MLWLFIGIAFALIGLDQWTKGLAVAALKSKPAITLIPGVLELTYVENKGVAFGMLDRFSKAPAAIAAVFFLALLIGCVVERDKLTGVLPFLIAFILSGAVGNLIDRIRLGYVVDFIYLRLIRFPVFNVADCCVVAGTVGLGLWIWMKKE